MTSVLAEVATAHLRVVLRSAPPVTLHAPHIWRADGNSPVLADHDGITVFFSHYEPRGHTLRRRGTRDFQFEDGVVPVRLVDDPDPGVGKWITAIRREGVRQLRGWYHAEESAPCPGSLVVPHIGEVASEDDGLTWRCRGDVLRAPVDQIDCAQRNGFVVGGYGDFCVVPDRANHSLYMPFTSYVADEDAQGVCMARLPAVRPASPAAGLELWCADGWQPSAGRLPMPIWPAARGWRHADPDAFWGPAIHYSHALKAYVALLNHTAGGSGNFMQEGVYVSVNAALDDPTGWTPPVQIVRGGAWYPQVVGLNEGSSDIEVAGKARLFMAGFSAWEIDIVRGGREEIHRPLCPTKDDFARLFDHGRRSPW